MNKKYTESDRQFVVGRYENGESGSIISLSTGIPKSTVYSWIHKTADCQEEKREFSLRAYSNLERKVERLEGIIEIIRKADCAASAPLAVKLAAMEKLSGKYNVHMLCEAMDVPRGTYYNHILRNKRDNTWYAKRREQLRATILQIYDDNRQILGAAKICSILREQGEIVSVEMVRELMRDMGIISIRDGAKDQYDKEQKRYKNYLNQQFDVTRPNAVWVSDVTCFRFKGKDYFICAIIDLYARLVVGYKVGRRNSTQLLKSTFQMAIKCRAPDLPLIFHSDRGANYRAKAFCDYVKEQGVTQSFSRAYVPYDNSVMESFFSNLKREELYRTKYRSELGFRTAVDEYIVFYNEKRPHAKNHYKTPLKKEQDYWEELKGP